MKILVVTNMWPGPRKPNFGVFVADRVSAYVDLGAEVEVVANSDPRKGSLIKALKYASLLGRALRAGRRFEPEVIEGHYLMPMALITRLVARLAGCPYVLYAHGSDLTERYSRLLASSVRNAAEIHTNSESSANRVRDLFGDVVAIVSPPGVDRDLFTPGTPEPGRIVFVGDLVAHKGVDVLLSAVALTEESKLTIVGDGPERSHLLKKAQSAGISDRIRWVGDVDHQDVPAFFADAWVAAVPSRSDALGQVAVEAMASGVPVVVSDVGGLAGVPDERSGTVVEAGNPEVLAEALNRWLACSPSDRKAAGEAARQRSSGHDLKKVAAGAMARLTRVAHRGQPR